MNAQYKGMIDETVVRAQVILQLNDHRGPSDGSQNFSTLVLTTRFSYIFSFCTRHLAQEKKPTCKTT